MKIPMRAIFTVLRSAIWASVEREVGPRGVSRILLTNI